MQYATILALTNAACAPNPTSTAIPSQDSMVPQSPAPISQGPDLDSDGVKDSLDNCPCVANADQSDGNGDGVGDACSAAFTFVGAPDVRAYVVPIAGPGAIHVAVSTQAPSRMRVSFTRGETDTTGVALEGTAPFVFSTAADPAHVTSNDPWHLRIEPLDDHAVEGVFQVTGDAVIGSPIRRKYPGLAKLLSKDNLFVPLYYHLVHRHLNGFADHHPTDLDHLFSALISTWTPRHRELRREALNRYLSCPERERQTALHPYAKLKPDQRLTIHDVVEQWRFTARRLPAESAGDFEDQNPEGEAVLGLRDAGRGEGSEATWRLLSVHMEDQQEEFSDEPVIAAFVLRDVDNIQFLRTQQFDDVDEECDSEWTTCGGATRCGETRTADALKEYTVTVSPGGGATISESWSETNVLFSGGFQQRIGRAMKAFEDDDCCFCLEDIDLIVQQMLEPFAILNPLEALGYLSVPDDEVPAAHRLLRRFMKEWMDEVIAWDSVCDEAYDYARGGSYTTSSPGDSCKMVHFNADESGYAVGPFGPAGRHLDTKSSLSHP